MTQGATTTNQGPVAPAEEVDPQDILTILAKHSEDHGGLIAILEDSSLVDVSKPVDHYLPELANSDFGGVTLSIVLYMA